MAGAAGCRSGLLKRSVAGIRTGKSPLDSRRLAEAMTSLITGSPQDPAFAALGIGLPTEGDLAREIAADIDPEAIGQALDHLRRALGQMVREPAARAYETLSQPVPFSPDGASAGRRALRASCCATCWRPTLKAGRGWRSGSSSRRTT